MNNRITQLANESGYMDKGTNLTAYMNFDHEKFAQLIVLECADVALEQKKWVEDQKAHNLNDESWNRARIQQSQLIVNKIREHFGVEE